LKSGVLIPVISHSDRKSVKIKTDRIKIVSPVELHHSLRENTAKKTHSEKIR
jgi:hypothetical protein